MTRTPPTSDPRTTAGASAAGADDEMGYADALAELEAILDELDGDEVDVDVLGARVRRAAELLRLCRSRIAGARFEVEQVVGELEDEAEAAVAASAADDDLDLDAEAEGDELGPDDP
jgi:exodeoxyribonuclease VII small subunit